MTRKTARQSIFLALLQSGVAFGLPRFSDKAMAAAEVVVDSFRKEWVVVSDTASAVQARVNWTRISEADCQVLESSLLIAKPGALPDLILLAGATKKRRFCRTLKRLKIPPDSRAGDFETWALAEMSINEVSMVGQLYQIFRTRKDEERSWTCLKLLVFSSSEQSRVVLDRMHNEGRDDGAVGGLVSLYRGYRGGLFSAFKNSLK
jgi:hypothetical protein